MSDIEHDERLGYADKIAKLLAKAENTDNEAEADSYNAMAQRLMVKYAISEHLLAQAQGRQVQEQIVEESITYKGIFHMALFNIGSTIARANDCKVLIYKFTGQTRTDLHVIGFESDVKNVKLFDASLQIQASTAMQRWYREQDTSWRSAMEKSKMRRTFLYGFADGLRAKLATARRDGVAQAVADETKRTGDAAAAKVSTDLVLVSKTKRVDEWVDNRYGNSLRTVKNRYTSTGYSDRSAGYRAGMAANVNQTGIGDGRREIGR